MARRRMRPKRRKQGFFRGMMPKGIKGWLFVFVVIIAFFKFPFLKAPAEKIAAKIPIGKKPNQDSSTE